MILHPTVSKLWFFVVVVMLLSFLEVLSTAGRESIHVGGEKNILSVAVSFYQLTLM